MGLPSGVRWASMNIGASSPEESGLFFSWGNVDGHAEGSGYNFSQEVYNATPGASIDTDLSQEEDAAHAYMRGSWRMPSDEDLQELIDNCTSTWVSRNGVYGRLFTSNINGNTLFLPAAGLFNGSTISFKGSRGYYWSSKYLTETSARDLYLNSTNAVPNDGSSRYQGFPIRAVLG